MDILYKDIIDRITDQVPAVKWSGWDNGEIDLVEKSYPVPFPNVLIDFVSYQPETVGQNVQHGTLQIRLRISFRIYNDMESIAPAASKTAGFTILKTLNNIFKALQGYAASDHYNELERISMNREQRDDELTVYVMEFITDFRDANAAPQFVAKSNNELKIYANTNPPATVADFLTFDTTVDINQTVSLIDLSTDAPTAWEWTFAPYQPTFLPGFNKNSQHPQVKFTQADIYNVTLKATNAFGDDTEAKADYISVKVPD